MSRIAVFLDRDGTINEDPGYLHDPARLRLLPGAAEAIAQLCGRGLLVILVTNQAGMARGYYSEEQFWQVQARMAEELGKAGARLDAVYFCPHHPEGVVEALSIACSCRKPAPGMLLRAAREHGIDLGRSYLIGDKLTDLEAGAAVGCRTLQVGAEHDLPAAVQWVLNDLDSR